MKDYPKFWAEELLTSNSLSLKSRITVIGERNQHTGGRWDFARIQLTVEPSEKFEVRDATPPNEELQAGYFDWAIFGLLDVLLTAESLPLSRVLVIVEKLEIHPVDSSQMAFRQAGRDAGRKIIEALKSFKA